MLLLNGLAGSLVCLCLLIVERAPDSTRPFLRMRSPHFEPILHVLDLDAQVFDHVRDSL